MALKSRNELQHETFFTNIATSGLYHPIFCAWAEELAQTAQGPDRAKRRQPSGNC